MTKKPKAGGSPPRDRAKALLADAFGVKEKTIPDDAAIGAFERWDSLAHIRVILGLEEVLERQLQSQEVVSIMGLADIEQLIAAEGS